MEKLKKRSVSVVIRIARDKCKGCRICLISCPRGLIVLDKSLNQYGVLPVYFKESAECTGCALCALVCPECCIEVYKTENRENSV